MDQSEMNKPRLEDVLFLNTCKHTIENENRVFSKKKSIDLCPVVKLSQKPLETLIRDELKDKYYPGFIKYFKSNSKDCIMKSVKNSQRSVEIRIKGNLLLARKDHNADIHEEIWKLYSTSIALAPVKSKELVLAYECRSNLLLHFKQYSDCIKDIDRALSLTEFDLLKVKLLCRKITCFVALNKDIVEKEKLAQILKHHIEKIDVAFKDDKFLQMIRQAKYDVYIKPDKKVKEEQQCFSSTASFSSIELTHNKERRIIANRDFGAGEAIIVTKPSIASVNPDKFHAYCSYCLSFMWAGIPCDNCSLCMYCSEECKKKAWEKYHILECQVNPHIDFNHPIYYEFSNSIKIFLMGVREFGSIPKLLEKIRKAEQLQDDPNFMKSDEIFDNKFLNFYTLPNMPSMDSCTLSNTVKNTCFLMAYLTQILGDIFEKDVRSMRGKELAKDGDFVYITYVILKIIMLCVLHMDYPFFTKNPKCSKYESIDECLTKRCCPVGTIFYFFKGLMEKSCNPNAFIYQLWDGKIIYYCVQPIKKMEVISVTQTVPFYIKDREERSLLKCCIPTVCMCIACVKNWPPILLKYGKFEAKFMRRSSKIQTEGTKLLEKHINRMAGKIEGNLLKLGTEEFQEFARDTNVVVNTCGQPSFASCWMIFMLGCAFRELYGDISIHKRIPNDC